MIADQFGTDVNMASFKINVKPTSGGDKLTLDVEETMTIAELKEALTALSSIPVEEQRLIYKGQVLKNERTVESYGKASRSVCALHKGEACSEFILRDRGHCS